MSAFRGKAAIVTGAGSGIGRATAAELCSRGARVVIGDISRERIEKVGVALAGCGGEVTPRQLDVTDHEAFRRLAADTKKKYGRIDYLFNVAGISVAGQALDLTIEDWREVIEVNLFGVVNGINAVYPIMAEQRSGHIVNVASLEGLVPFAANMPYSASKFAVVGLTGGLRNEAVRYGVRASVVCPGYVDTPIFDESRAVNMDREKAKQSIRGIKPMQPDECARRMLRGVALNQATIVITGPARLAWIMNRISPELTRMIVRPGMNIILDSRMKK